MLLIELLVLLGILGENLPLDFLIHWPKPILSR